MVTLGCNLNQVWKWWKWGVARPNDKEKPNFTARMRSEGLVSSIVTPEIRTARFELDSMTTSQSLTGDFHVGFTRRVAFRAVGGELQHLIPQLLPRQRSVGRRHVLRFAVFRHRRADLVAAEKAQLVVLGFGTVEAANLEQRVGGRGGRVLDVTAAAGVRQDLECEKSRDWTNWAELGWTHRL